MIKSSTLKSVKHILMFIFLPLVSNGKNSRQISQAKKHVFTTKSNQVLITSMVPVLFIILAGKIHFRFSAMKDGINSAAGILSTGFQVGLMKVLR